MYDNCYDTMIDVGMMQWTPAPTALAGPYGPMHMPVLGAQEPMYQIRQASQSNGILRLLVVLFSDMLTICC